MKICTVRIGSTCILLRLEDRILYLAQHFRDIGNSKKHYAFVKFSHNPFFIVLKMEIKKLRFFFFVTYHQVTY